MAMLLPVVVSALLASANASASAGQDQVTVAFGLEVLQGLGWSQAQDPAQEDGGDGGSDGKSPVLDDNFLPPFHGPAIPWLDPVLPPASPPPSDQDPMATATLYASVMREQFSDTDFGVDTTVGLDLHDLLDLLGDGRDALPRAVRETLDELTVVDFASTVGSFVDLPVDEGDDASEPLGDGFPVRRVSFGMRIQDHVVDMCFGPDCAVLAAPGVADGAPGAPQAGMLADPANPAAFHSPADALAVLDPYLLRDTAPPAPPAAFDASGIDVRGFPAQGRFMAPAPGMVMLALLALGALLPAAGALYSKIRRETALRNATRMAIYQTVSVQPGLSIQELARRSSTSHSTAAYHLERLTRARLVVPTHDGNKVRYYPNGGRFTERERKFLPCLENAETTGVLETVLHRPWTYRAELASSLGVTATTVSWHLKRILACGVVCEVREGRNAHLFVDRAVLRELCEGLRQKVPPSSPVCEVADRLLAQLGPAEAAVAPLPPVESTPASAAERFTLRSGSGRTPTSPAARHAASQEGPATGTAATPPPPPAKGAPEWPSVVPPRSAPGW